MSHGLWEGTLGPGALELRLVVRGSSVRAEFPSLGQAGFEATPPSSVTGAAQLHVPTPAGALAMTGTVRGKSFEGDWTFLGRSGSFRLERRQLEAQPWNEQEVDFRSADGTLLSGVILAPNRRGRFPTFVGVHGSGTETRAGANRFYAERFVREGGVVLLFDKRGSGRSQGDWRTATLEQLAGDVEAALATARRHAQADPGRTGLFGASQAGWVSAIVAGRDPCLRYLIMRSAVLTSVAEEGQYDYLARLAGQPSEVLQRARAILVLDDEVTRSGRGHAELLAMVEAARREPWFERMRFTPAPPQSPSRLSYRQWLNFDPALLLQRSRAAGLWIYGRRDETIPAERSAAIARALSSAARPFEVITIAGASHGLHRPPAPGGHWPVLAPEAVDSTLRWYRRNVASGTRRPGRCTSAVVPQAASR